MEWRCAGLERAQKPSRRAKVSDEIKKPTEITVIEEQKDMHGSKAQRAKITYDVGREGWVLSDAISVKP